MEIEKVMKLGFCTEEEARKALEDTHGDVVEAIIKVMDIPESKWIPKKKEQDETQKYFNEMRRLTSIINNNIEEGLKKKDQPGASLPAEKSIQMSPGLRYLDYDYTQNSHLEVLDEEEQTPETACQKQSECSSDSQ
jgi:hypothetical protein